MDEELEKKLTNIFAQNGEWDQFKELVVKMNKRLFQAQADDGLPMVTEVQMLKKAHDEHLEFHEKKKVPYDRFLWLIITGFTMGLIGFFLNFIIEKLSQGQ